MFWCSHSNDPSETGQQKRGGPSGFQATSKWKSLHGHDPCTKGETSLNYLSVDPNTGLVIWSFTFAGKLHLNWNWYLFCSPLFPTLVCDFKGIVYQLTIAKLDLEKNWKTIRLL